MDKGLDLKFVNLQSLIKFENYKGMKKCNGNE